jgi:DNA modification methylase
MTMTKRRAVPKQKADLNYSQQPDYSIGMLAADARCLPFMDESVDCIISSPPYFRKRDYYIKDQIGKEKRPSEYVEHLAQVMSEWHRILKPSGSAFLNIGDTRWKGGLAGIPAMVEEMARHQGWVIVNRIIWTKPSGMPAAARRSLVSRYEYVFHLALSRSYYNDLWAFSERFGDGANPGDVWHIQPARRVSEDDEMVPFPEELVERALVYGCPERVCSACGIPSIRRISKTAELKQDRPQARRAVELAKQHGLTDQHFAAIRATGISDAGTALRFQSGTGKNSADVKRLAAEAKQVLGGYFREFTFGKRVFSGWKDCTCNAPQLPGLVFDSFIGSGTAIQVARRLGLRAVGSDLNIEKLSTILLK